MDPISLEEIPDEFLISFEQLGVTFCYDIRTLSEYVRLGKEVNPLNREPLPDITLKSIHEYIESQRYMFNAYMGNIPIMDRIEIYGSDTLGDLLITIFRKIGNLPVIIGYDVVLDGKVKIYDHSLSKRLGDLIDINRFDHRIYLTKNDGNLDTRMKKLFLFAIGKDIEWLINISSS